MGQTVVEKIIAHNIGRDSVKAGEIVTVQVDRVMMDDIMVPFIVDKFKEMNLTKEPAKFVKCPMIKESPVSIECRVKEIKELGSHHMFIAEVLAIHADNKYIDEKGAFDISKCDLVAYANGGYYALGKKVGKFGFSVQKKKKK